MTTLKSCPHCGSNQFLVSIQKGGIGVVEKAEDGSTSIKVTKELDGTDISIFRCAHCKNDVTEQELIDGVKCSKCGRIVSPDEVDENGVCSVCNAPEELLNASKEDLIRMLINARKDVKVSQSNIAKKETKAAQTEVKVNDNLVDEVLKDIGQETQATVEEPKKRKKAKRKTSPTAETAEQTEPAKESVAEQKEEPKPVSETVPESNNIDANSAPFPDVPDIQTEVPSSNTTTQVTTDNMNADDTSSFKMFDNDDTPF